MRKLLAFILLPLLVTLPVYAHHSYAIYDIENKIQITGVLKRFEFGQPHIELELLVATEDGRTEHWLIESTSPQRWDRLGKPRQVASVGETVTIEGWPARNGRDEMLLSSIATANGKTVIIDRVRQRRAREGIY